MTRTPVDSSYKSIELWIYNLVSKFEYSDFMPPVRKEALKQKFEDIFSAQNPYWRVFDASPEWKSGWFFIEFLTFRPWDPARLGFCFNSRCITYSLFDEILLSKFHHEYETGEICVIESWLDHKYLADQLITLIKKGIKFSNRSSQGEEFESGR